jgi:hypothetical protein
MNIPFEVETARSAVHFVLAMLIVVGLGIWVSRNEDKDKGDK